MDEAHKHHVQLLESGEDASESFESSEQALNFIASAVHDPVVPMAPPDWTWVAQRE